MAKKKKLSTNFIDEVKRFSSHENFKIGDWVVYVRYSDKKTSVGEIKWFCKTSEGMAISVIDKNLGNFQLGLCSSIKEECDAKTISRYLKPKKTK